MLRDTGAVLWWVVVVVIVLAGLMFGSFYAYQYFNPKYEAVRRQTFEESRAFNEGMVRDLENLRLEYIGAAPEKKAALRSVILHRFSVYDGNRLSFDLRQFYDQLQRGE